MRAVSNATARGSLTSALMRGARNSLVLIIIIIVLILIIIITYLGCSGALCEFQWRRRTGSGWLTRGSSKTGASLPDQDYVKYSEAFEVWRVGGLECCAHHLIAMLRTNEVQLSRRDGGRNTLLSYRYSQRFLAPTGAFIVMMCYYRYSHFFEFLRISANI